MQSTTSCGRRWRQTIGPAAASLLLMAAYGAPAIANGAPQQLLLAQASPPPLAAPAAGTGQARPAPKPKPKAPPPATAAPAADAGLKQRVEQLEAQLVDLQVAIGTLESLAKSAGTASSSATFRAGGAANTGDAERVGVLETQLRALVQQVELLNDRVRAAEAGGRQAAAAQPPAQSRPAPSVGGSGFGQTIVTPGSGRLEGDGIGQLIGRADGEPAATPPRRQTAAVDAANAGPGARQLYETAYGHLLQQDYGAAEFAFDDFLQRFPGDQLAGSAQYWLGETHFARGQFKAAAQAFLKGYQDHARSPKAPDSLLKLAMSLERLGQREAACTSFAELATRFPAAPSQTRVRAQTERQRLGCR